MPFPIRLTLLKNMALLAEIWVRGEQNEANRDLVGRVHDLIEAID